MNRGKRILLVATLMAGSLTLPTVGFSRQELSYSRDVRPILSENCFYCHGQDANKREADLRLDEPDSAIETGAIVPGDAAASSLIERILESDPDLQMPPANSNRHLTEKQTEILKRWIDEGAQYETHWAFVAPQRPAIPNASDWIRNPIDAFVLEQMQIAGANPSPEADRATLIKRLYSDLIGLPPSPIEVRAFVNDPASDAYERLVDRLLASEHYGERLALPWLDAARYADSNGFQQDGDTWQWMWRDWVVKSLNEDLPFDQFTVWQLAGDLLPDATVEQKIASGFNRNHLLNGEGGAIAEEQRFNVLFDRVDTTATNWLGLTMACAQCHDHKYDPITTQDYYRLLDAFNRVPESGVPDYFSPRIRVGKPVLEVLTDENRAQIAEFEKQIADLEPLVNQRNQELFQAWRLGVEADGSVLDLPETSDKLVAAQKSFDEATPELKDDAATAIAVQLREYFDSKVRSQLPNSKNDEQLQRLRNELASYRADQIPRPMIMSDERPRETFVLSRGNYLTPEAKVEFDTPAFLPSLPESATRDRLGFANWLVASENPLTARVQVNRMWQYFFGTGLVKTTEDLGVQSEYPLHKDLLDWLAVEFRENGWSQKSMHRLIVTSATYRQSSRMNEWHRANDPENKFLSRASRLRMPVMVLRDWALASSGLLNDVVGGQPVYPYQPDSVWESLAITKERDFTYPQSTGEQLYRRSLYTFWRRTVGPTNMFDNSNRQTCRVRTTITSTPLHALTTLNDPTWVEAARCLAERSMEAANSAEARIKEAFERVTCRQPAEKELSVLLKSYETQRGHFQSNPVAASELLSVGASPRNEQHDSLEHAAMTAVCLAIFNLDESLVRE
ncbi:MAG: PSD1 and planctomycete cytochrome C domain-containing protein [Pirellulaceae bacterium]